MSLRNLGIPIKGICVWAAAYGQVNGEMRIYAVSSGKPCVLFVIDPGSGRCLERLPLEGAAHSWGVVATDTGVYITGDGNLYRYTAADGIEQLGTVIQGESYTWRSTAGKDGSVYGGCYPGGKAFRYEPSTGRFHDYGQIVSGEQYVRCMKEWNGKLYIGIGTQKPHLIEMDTASGAKRVIQLPTDSAGEQMVYDLDIAYPKLFIRLTPSSSMYVYDMEDEAWGERIEDVLGLAVSPPGDDGLAYFAREGFLCSYNVENGQIERTAAELSEPIVDFAWMDRQSPERPGRSLLWVNRNGSYSFYHPGTGHYETIRVELEGQPVAVHAITQGPDGCVYAGGYFAGGLAKFDPIADELTLFRDIGQIENMIAYKGSLYAGVYPKALIYRYDPSMPWVNGGNPKLLFSLRKHRQDRPFAFVDAGDRLAIGTVADYGNLSGAITLYDPAQDRYDIVSDIVKEQSIISLAARDGIMYAGSSIWGGLGIPPSQPEAKLVAWDIANACKLWEGVPVAEEKAVSALVFDGDGMLWGLTRGWLFRFDPERKEITRKVRLFDFDWSGLPLFWRGGYLKFHADGHLFGSTLGRLFRFDLRTEAVTVMDEQAELFGHDRDWNLYFARGTELYQYRQNP